MFGPGKTFLEKDLQDWHVDCWSWLMRWGARHRAIDYTSLILPTPQFFPKSGAEGHARAVHIFNTVKRLAGMEEWPAKLIQQERIQRELGPMQHVEHGRTCAGTFSQRDNTALITYDPDKLKQPVHLVATFAHELGHYFLYGFPVLIQPREMEEHATDVSTIYLGFGLFGANTALNFRQHGGFDGWSTQRLGYLSEAEWVFGLAMFGALSGDGVERMKDHLKPTMWGEVKRAAKIIERDGLAEKARAQATARSKR